MDQPRLAELLATPAARHALAHHHIADLYRVLTESGIPQREIARRTGQTQSAVSEVLAGRQVHQVKLLERICDGLGVPRGWMGLAYTPEVDSAYREGSPPEVDDMRRRDLLATASLALFGQVTLTGNHPPHPDRPLPDRIGPGDVRIVRDATAHWRALDHAHGGHAVHNAISATARHNTRLLHADAKASTHRGLLVAVADQHRVAGWTAVDCGLYHRARWHFQEGVRLAGAADDRALAALIVDAAGRMELQRDEPNEALKLFQLATIRHNPTQPVPPLLHATTATAYARLGATRDAHRHLTESREADGPLRVAVDGQAGHTLLALGELEQAAATLGGVLTARGHDPAEARARCLEHASLATAHLRAGNLDAGTGSARQCLNLVGSLRSTSALGALRPLGQAAADRKDSACRDIAKQVRTLVAA